MLSSHRVDADSNTEDSEVEECSSSSHISFSDDEGSCGHLDEDAGYQPIEFRLLLEGADVERLLPHMLSPPLMTPIRSVCPDRRHR